MANKPETDYIKLYQDLHSQEADYGTSGSNYFDEVCLVIDYLKPKSVLDYGCGKAVLIKQLQEKYPDIQFYGYDPAIPERAKMPIDRADLVINTDVLEHIPEKQLPDVIKKISELSPRVFFGVHHALAYTLLSNGENAHCTVKPVFWYYHLLEKHFPNLTVLQGRESYLHTILTFPVKPHFIKSYETIMEHKNEKIMAELQKNIETLNTKYLETKQSLDVFMNSSKQLQDKTNERFVHTENAIQDLVRDNKRKRYFRFLGLKIKIHRITKD